MADYKAFQAVESAMAERWQAWCDSTHGLTYGWMGPERATEQEAEDDADEHKRSTFDHQVAIDYLP
jgi:hypothetical protein